MLVGPCFGKGSKGGPKSPSPPRPPTKVAGGVDSGGVSIQAGSKIVVHAPAGVAIQTRMAIQTMVAIQMGGFPSHRTTQTKRFTLEPENHPETICFHAILAIRAQNEKGKTRIELCFIAFWHRAKNGKHQNPLNSHCFRATLCKTK